MNAKVLLGVASGAIIGGGITYATLNKKIKEYQDRAQRYSEEAEKLAIEKAEMIDNHEKEFERVVEDRDELIKNYEDEIDELKKVLNVQQYQIIMQKYSMIKLLTHTISFWILICLQILQIFVVRIISMNVLLQLM